MADYTPVRIPAVHGGGIPNYQSTPGAPGPMVMDGDVLILSTTTSDSTGVLDFRGRHLRVDGEIVPFERSITFSGTGVQTDVVATLSAGWLIGFSVTRVSGTFTQGEVAGAVFVGRNAGALQQKVMCLASGEIGMVRGLGLGAFGTPWVPGTTVTPAPEAATKVTVAAPAAGADWTLTVPASTVYKLYTLCATLQADATVANRIVVLSVDDGTNKTWGAFTGTNVTASQTIVIGWGNVGASNTGSVTGWGIVAPFPLYLSAGWRVRVVTGNLQAADQWSNIFAHVTSYSV